MRTVRMEQFRKRTIVRLINWYLFITALIVVAVLVLPGRPWEDGLVGILSAGLIMGISAFTLDRMVNAEGIAVGWLAADYVGKILVAGAAILFTKEVLHHSPLLVAGAVIAAVVFTAFVPILAAQVHAADESLPE